MDGSNSFMDPMPLIRTFIMIRPAKRESIVLAQPRANYTVATSHASPLSLHVMDFLHA
jgi:hypothetical protein